MSAVLAFQQESQGLVRQVTKPKDHIFPPTNERIDGKWYRYHFGIECIGSLLFVFAGCMQAANPYSSVYYQAAAFSTFFGAIRATSKNINLNPLFTLHELVIYPSLLSFKGIATAIATVLFQLLGAYAGAELTHFFYKKFPNAMENTVTRIPTQIAQNGYVDYQHIIISEMIFTFLFAISSIHIQYKKSIQHNKTMETNNNKSLHNEAFELEPIATGTIYFAALYTLCEYTGGSLVFTRSLGPAFVTGIYTDLEYYLCGQLCGEVIALFIFIFFIKD